VLELLNGGKMSKDEYYANTTARIDTLVGDAGVYYIRLRRVKEEWDRLAEQVAPGVGFLTFYDYVKEYYGIKMITEGDEIGLSYVIIDDQKHTLFLLKFGQ
jgi:hypothetical protein